MSVRITVRVNRTRVTLGTIPSGGGGGSGDVTGPSSSTDGGIVVFDGTTGKVIKAGSLAGIGAQPLDADLTAIAALATTGVARRTGAGAWTLDPATATGLALLGAADASAGRTALGVVIGTDVQAYSALLAAHAALSATGGIIAKTGAATVAARTLTGPAAGLTITDGDGAAGNPTFALANDLAALEGLAGTGFSARTAADTWAIRSIAGTSPISVANGDGGAGNPTVSVAAASTSAAGVVELATDGETGLAVVPTGSDSRLSNARTPTAHASSHVGGGSDAIAEATRTARGLVTASIRRTGSVGYYIAQHRQTATMANLALVAGRLYAVLFDQQAAGEFDRITCDVTTGSAGGTTLRLAVYTIGAAGIPDQLIWYSGTIDANGTGGKDTAFSAGTWVDTSYQSGNNLMIPLGARVALSVFPESTPTLRALAAAGAETSWGIPAPAWGTTDAIAHARATTPPAYGVPPTTFGTGITFVNNSATPAIGLRAA